MERSQALKMMETVSRMRVQAEPDDEPVVTRPKKPKDIIGAPDEQRWLEAQNKEVAGFLTKGTIEFVDENEIPKGRKPIKCVPKYSVKYKGGKVDKYKVRWVAQGQKEEFLADYMDTHAPTPMVLTVQLLIIMSIAMGLELYVMDVEQAFLNSEMSRFEIYVELTEGVGFPKKFGRLLKSVYGLKQAAHDWHNALHELLRKFGLTASEADPSIYYLYVGEGSEAMQILMCIYVDDLLSAISATLAGKQWYKELPGGVPRGVRLQGSRLAEAIHRDRCEI
jgi:hypothetical protein